MSIVGILWRAVVVVVFGYLLGGIPFGVIVSRRTRGVDIQTVGSGNTGTTNVLRSVGRAPAATVAFFDIAKGALPVLLAMTLADKGWGTTGTDLLVCAGGVSAMVGHVFSPYIRLRGGKGVATAAGVILVMAPKVFAALLVVFFVAALATRIVSVASLLIAVGFPIAFSTLYPGRPVLLAFAVGAALFVIWTHRSNIGRLARGEEPRLTMGRAGKRERGE